MFSSIVIRKRTPSAATPRMDARIEEGATVSSACPSTRIDPDSGR
jgi:hypothetical protein